MKQEVEVISEIPQPHDRWKRVLRNTAYIFFALLIFLFALDLMISSLQHLGKDVDELIIQATSNPFTGLFIGLLVTALIQSSSASSAMVVALVASGSITLEGAIPILMGANVGTTITSTIVSLGFIARKKEFRRAMTIGTYHDFFNILTVIILFPLEYYFNFLSGIATYVATSFFDEPMGGQVHFSLLSQGFSPVINFIVDLIGNGLVLAILSIVLLFGSILFFRKVLTHILGFGSQEMFQRFFFRSSIKSFGWGLLTTAAIRSSTVTTTLVVPLVAKKIVKIKSAQPFILGANIGTTITAFIAAMFNSNTAVSIAIAHFVFNVIGVILFYGIPFLRQVPIRLADKLGELTLRYRLTGFLYLLLTFFFIPFSLIYLNKGAVETQEIIYEDQLFPRGEKSRHRLLIKKYPNQALSNWIEYRDEPQSNQIPYIMFSVYRRNNLLMIERDVYEFNKPGFCKDGEDKQGKYHMCVKEVLAGNKVNSLLSGDSIYVFDKHWYGLDSIMERVYINATQNFLVKRERRNQEGTVLESREMLELRKK